MMSREGVPQPRLNQAEAWRGEDSAEWAPPERSGHGHVDAHDSQGVEAPA